jgi:hypothetical protein
VRLVHSGLTPEQAAGHLEGWNHYGERLVAAAERGDAGADEWAASEPGDPLTAAEASLAVCQAVLRGLRPEHGSAQTPCAKFTVDDLVEHLVGSLRFLADAAQVTLEAWRKRGLDGTVNLGRSEMPAAAVADILCMEFLVHAWDFAQATAQAVAVDDRLSGYVLERGRSLIAPQMRDGDSFAAELEAGPEADNLARLVAFTGREA